MSMTQLTFVKLLIRPLEILLLVSEKHFVKKLNSQPLHSDSPPDSDPEQESDSETRSEQEDEAEETSTRPTRASTGPKPTSRAIPRPASGSNVPTQSKRPRSPPSRKKSKSQKGKAREEQLSPSPVNFTCGAGTFLNPFHIEDFMERDLTYEPKNAESRVSGPKVPLFGPIGHELDWEPTFHVSDFYIMLGNFLNYSLLQSLQP